MSEHLLIGIAIIIVTGIAAQWLAWRLRWPSIVLLLSAGIIGGPLTQLIKPDEVLGPLLFPMVSISVAIILFEGGFGLKFRELKNIATTVFNLVTIGAFITWGVIALAAYFILHLNLSIAVLLGAILVVTGPTVVNPLLRHIRPIGNSGKILKWEGMVIDPIGAALAVLVFEYIISSSGGPNVIIFFLKGILIGTAAGALGAGIILLLLKRYLVPDYLHGTVTLMFVVLIFVLSNVLHPEGGLFAVIVMGAILANQEQVEIQHIFSFKENLSILVISILFIVLGARLNRDDFDLLHGNFFIFLFVVVFVARPLCVLASTIRGGLTVKERIFISAMAPRGIVAAAVSSVFAYKLSERGIPQAEYLVSFTFFVIIATVIIYGLSSLMIAKKLGISKKNPQGILMLGAYSWIRILAKKLQDEGIKIILIDSNAKNTAKAMEEGLTVYEGNVMSQEIDEVIDLDDIGRFMALTPNDEANSLSALHFRDLFGRAEVYQLFPQRKTEKKGMQAPVSLRGRYLFGENITYDFLENSFNKSTALQVVKLQKDTAVSDLKLEFGEKAVPLFVLNDAMELKIFSVEEKPALKAGNRLVLLMDK